MENYFENTDDIINNEIIPDASQVDFQNTLKAVKEIGNWNAEKIEKQQLIDFLKENTQSPIDWVEDMRILSEKKAMNIFINFLTNKVDQKIKEWKKEETVYTDSSGNGISREKLWEILNDNSEWTEARLRDNLYKLLSDNTNLYEEILEQIADDKFWCWFILWVEDRWDRWWDIDGGWGMHMWVDYNLPAETPVNSIYEWKVIAKRYGRTIEGDQTVIKHINEIYWENGKTDNMLIIEHKAGRKTFYSLYLHITNKENLKVGDKVDKWQKIWKIAGYEENGNRQPHLHFTIMTNLDNRPMLSWYFNKLTMTDEERNSFAKYSDVDAIQNWWRSLNKWKLLPKLDNEYLREEEYRVVRQNSETFQNLYEKYAKDMIDPMEVYDHN